MRRIRLVVLAAVCVCLLSSCGQKPAEPDEPVTLFPPHSETETDAPAVSRPAGAALANKTYGQTTVQEPVGVVTDYSETFRSDASYALEDVALSAAKSMFAATISQPDTLSVRDVQVIGCADDGENVYYRIFFRAAYRVETGQEIRRDSFQNVGVRLSDKSTFDAVQTISDVFERYSIFTNTIITDEIPQADSASPDFESAALQIASMQLKAPQSGKAVRAVRRDDLCDEPEMSGYDVLCTGVNDYGDEIPCVYTVYMTLDHGAIRQLDPMRILK